ncbi:hypothetical protein Ancab_002293 [Ancistrocladus abbreviatus]
MPWMLRVGWLFFVRLVFCLAVGVLFLWQVCAPFPLLAFSLAAVFGAGCFTGCSRCSLADGVFTIQLEVCAGRPFLAEPLQLAGELPFLFWLWGWQVGLYR